MQVAMRKLYIQGLVKTADRVRRALVQPLSSDGKQELSRLVDESLRQVDEILTSHAARLEDLPPPTRRAYQFLANLDLDATPTITTSLATEAPAASAGSVRLTGLKSFWDKLLLRLARASSPSEHEGLHHSIHSASHNIEHYVTEHGIAIADLTAQSRTIRGWLAFFADRGNFDTYVTAIARARPHFEIALTRAQHFEPPAWLEFRSIPGLFKLRGYRHGTRIMLPTPMICFSEGLFGALAEASLNGGSRQSVMEATSGDEYQSIQAELEALSGADEQTSGLHHDLRASFDRVNGRYFSGTLTSPRLTWSRTFAGSKFGHYDPIRNTVMIGSTLDHPEVPAFVVDFVMYHELLHKTLGAEWRNGRQAVHTPEFRTQERRFEQYAAAAATLRKLAALRR